MGRNNLRTKAGAGPCVAVGCRGSGYMPRGLCRVCYMDPVIRGKYACRGRGYGECRVVGGKGLAAAACPYPVGSDEQLQLLALRLAGGFDLFHPGDSRDVVTREPQSEPQSGPRSGAGKKTRGKSGDRVYTTHFAGTFFLVPARLSDDK